MENYNLKELKHTKELEKMKILLTQDYSDVDTIAKQNEIKGKLELIEEILPIIRSIEIENSILQQCKNTLKSKVGDRHGV